MGCIGGTTKRVEMLAYKEGEFKPAEDIVISEYGLEVVVNGTKYESIVCYKSCLKEMVAGRLLCDGVIKSAADILEIRLDDDMGRCEVRINKTTSASPIVDGRAKNFSAAHILGLVSKFVKKSEIFSETGAVHSCALCDEQGFLFFAEDISRHNAIDKAIGHMVLAGVSPGDCFAVSSGRVPIECLEKFMSAGIQVVVSKSAVTDLAAEAAAANGITLVGFARGSRLNIYAAPWRITK